MKSTDTSERRWKRHFGKTMIATLRKDDGGMKPMKNKIYLQLFAEGAGEAGGAEVETGLEGQND